MDESARGRWWPGSRWSRRSERSWGSGRARWTWRASPGNAASPWNAATGFIAGGTSTLSRQHGENSLKRTQTSDSYIHVALFRGGSESNPSTRTTILLSSRCIERSYGHHGFWFGQGQFTSEERPNVQKIRPQEHCLRIRLFQYKWHTTTNSNIRQAGPRRRERRPRPRTAARVWR